MTISPVSPIIPALAPTGAAAPADSLGDRFSAAFGELVEAQARARQSAAAWEQGLTHDLSAVMIDQQVSSLGFQLALNVRNRALSAYRDIMNMPV